MSKLFLRVRSVRTSAFAQVGRWIPVCIQLLPACHAACPAPKGKPRIHPPELRRSDPRRPALEWFSTASPFAPRQEALAGTPRGRPGVVRRHRAPEGAHVAGRSRHDPDPTPWAGTEILPRTGQEHLHLHPRKITSSLPAMLAASSAAMLPYRSGSRPRSNNGSRASHRSPRLPSGTLKPPMLG
jgi:hypothetical protein